MKVGPIKLQRYFAAKAPLSMTRGWKRKIIRWEKIERAVTLVML
jgi:hypothetical protein